MKKVLIALVTAGLLLAPVSLVNAAPKAPTVSKCSPTDLKTQSTLDAAVKAAEKASAKAKATAAKLKTKKAKAEAALKKAKAVKTDEIKGAGELKAKLQKAKNNIAAINKRITKLKGTALAKAEKDLAAALKEQTRLNGLVSAANTDVAEATEEATALTEEVAEAVEELEVVEEEIEESTALATKKKSDLTKAKGKCKK